MLAYALIPAGPGGVFPLWPKSFFVSIEEVSVSTIYYPMLAMFLWTFLVALRNVQVRVAAVLKRELTNEYFELFRGADPPDIVIKTGNHLKNLFEFPVLFYVVLLMAAVAGVAASEFLVLAWLYVVLRVIHGIVHLSVNKVPVRFGAFFLSNLVLLAMWLWLAINAEFA